MLKGNPGRRIFDVAADIRPGSPTYGQWVSTVLSSENRRSIFITPEAPR